jgi:hypothetical protein
LLRTLAFIHSRGLIHCDIKPKNVLIRPGRDGRPQLRLIDFHLAISKSDVREGMARGTIPYIAPELLAGQPFDQRADLFSVGILVYRTLTGRLPEVSAGCSPKDAKLAGELSELRPDLPRELASWIMTLIAARPELRPASAREALRRLRALTGDELLIETRRTAQAYLQRGALCGREDLLRRFRSQIQSAIESRHRREALAASPALTLIYGEEGTGKTRLLEAVAIEAELAGLSCLRLTAGSGRRFSPFLALLQSSLEELGLSDLLAELAPDGLLDSQRMTERHQARGGSGDLIEAFAALLEELSRARPILALIDDFDEADAESWKLAQRLSHGHLRGLILLAARLAPEPWSGAACALASLDEETLKRLLEGLLGEAVPAVTARRFWEATGGNPGFVEETLRAFAEDGTLIDRDGAPRTSFAHILDIETPRSMLSLVKARVAALRAEEREALALLSLSARARPLEFFAAALRVSRSELEERLRRAMEKGWVEQRSLGLQASYRIPHGALRAALAEAHDEDWHREMHGRFARLLEARHPASMLPKLASAAGHEDYDREAELAWHLACAGDLARVQALSLELAERAATRAQRAQARRLFQWQPGPELEGSQKLRWCLALALSSGPRATEALEAWERALAQGDWSEAERVAALAAQTSLRLRLGELEAAQEALAAKPAAMKSLPELVAELALWRGGPIESLNPSSRAAAWLRGEAPRASAWLSAFYWPLASWASEDLGQTERWLQSREPSALELGDGEEAARSAIIAGHWERARGAWESALERYERALLISEDWEQLLVAALARLAIGSLLIASAELEDGLASLELAWHTGQRAACPWLRGYAALELSRLQGPERERWRAQAERDLSAHGPALAELSLLDAEQALLQGRVDEVSRLLNRVKNGTISWDQSWRAMELSSILAGGACASAPPLFELGLWSEFWSSRLAAGATRDHFAARLSDKERRGYFQSRLMLRPSGDPP